MDLQVTPNTVGAFLSGKDKNHPSVPEKMLPGPLRFRCTQHFRTPKGALSIEHGRHLLLPPFDPRINFSPAAVILRERGHKLQPRRCHSEGTGPQTFFSLGVVSEESAFVFRYAPPGAPPQRAFSFNILPINKARNPFSSDCRQTWALGAAPSTGRVNPLSSTSRCRGVIGQSSG